MGLKLRIAERGYDVRIYRRGWPAPSRDHMGKLLNVEPKYGLLEPPQFPHQLPERDWVDLLAQPPLT